MFEVRPWRAFTRESALPNSPSDVNRSVSLTPNISTGTFGEVDAEIVDARWADALRPWVDRDVKMKCGKCGHVLDTLIAVVSDDSAYICGKRVPDDRLSGLGPGDARAKRARSGRVSVRYLGSPLVREWTCKCGRTYRQSAVRLRPAFLRHARAGAPLVLSS